MKRILNIETPKHIGKQVRVCGWVNSRRDHGGIVFLDVRDRSGILQVVCQPDSAKDIKDECVLEIIGQVKKRPPKMVNPELETGTVEVEVGEIKILAEANSLPFEIRGDLNLGLPTLLDYRPLTLRNEKIRAIFKIEEEIISSFRKTLKDLEFTEFQAPTIVPVATEGGAELFTVDYYDYKAYLGQSPQLYKQIMLGAFERVFTVTKAYRAEPSVTTRHISEYISLDAEMGFIDSWEELMDTCEIIIKNMFDDVQKNCQKQLEMFGISLSKISSKIPHIKMRQAQEIIFKRIGRDNRKEPDLEPEDEKEICQWAKEKHDTELIFITHYPTKKRPFYTYPDPINPEYTLSFDLLYRGVEIVTGGQRIHEFDKLSENIKKWGNKIRDFQFYLQAFKYGIPPEGGFALGAERIVKQILDLENIREATLFPRDMIRIDQRLSVLQPKKKSKKKNSKK